MPLPTADEYLTMFRDLVAVCIRRGSLTRRDIFWLRLYAKLYADTLGICLAWDVVGTPGDREGICTYV